MYNRLLQNPTESYNNRKLANNVEYFEVKPNINIFHNIKHD